MDEKLENKEDIEDFLKIWIDLRQEIVKEIDYISHVQKKHKKAIEMIPEKQATLSRLKEKLEDRKIYYEDKIDEFLDKYNALKETDDTQK